MNTLVLYGTQYGYTAECAAKLKAELSGDVTLVDLSKGTAPELGGFDTVIVETVEARRKMAEPVACADYAFHCAITDLNGGGTSAMSNLLLSDGSSSATAVMALRLMLSNGFGGYSAAASSVGQRLTGTTNHQLPTTIPSGKKFRRPFQACQHRGE